MRKWGIVITLVLVAALALPVLGKTAAQDDSGFVRTFDLPTEPAAEGPLAGVDPSGQTITWWHNHTGGREEFLTQIIDEFNTNNPWGITMEASNQGSYGDIYNKMIAGIPTGDVPNLVVAYQNNAAAYHLANGLVDDLDEYVLDPQWGLNEAEIADFIPGFYNQDYTPDGTARIGFPPNRSSEALYYNQTALEELGFDGPPTSWEEFREMACAFTEQGWSGYEGEDTIGYTVRTDASFIAAATFALGGEVYENGQFVYNSPETIEFMQTMVDLYNDGCAGLIAEQFGDQNNFTAGRALFYTGSTSGLPFIRSGIEEAFAEPFEWHVGFIPYDGTPVANVYGASVSIPRTTPEGQLAAWLFVRWMTESEQQAKWAEVSNYYPVRFSTAENMGTLFEDFPQYEDAWNLIQGETMVEPQLASYDVIRDEAEATFDNLLAGGGDVETALTELTNTANEIQESFQPTE
ncbi:MAG: extracellular solute-binding protein [Chloroflexi bacterium]|nr:extracellular solute-binding protein [Chloroflexota bacterium]